MRLRAEPWGNLVFLQITLDVCISREGKGKGKGKGKRKRVEGVEARPGQARQDKIDVMEARRSATLRS
jgi:hypothetical protein